MIYAGILAFFVLEYVRPSNYFPAMARVNSLLPLLVAVAAILAPGRVSNQELFEDRTSRWLLVYLGLLALSVLTSDVTQVAWQVFLAVLGYTLMYWAISKHVSSLRGLRGVFKALLFVHLLIAALNPSIFSATDRPYISAGAFLGDGNDLALSVNIAIPLCLFLLFESSTWIAKTLYTGVLLALVLCLVVTQSRGGTLALMSVGAYYLWTSKQRVRVGLALASAAVLILVVAPPAYFARMNDMTNAEEGSAQGRIAAWNAAIRMAGDNPVLGVGAGLFGVTYGANYGSTIGPKTAHSIYFLTLGELGFPGLACLLALIVSSLAANWRLASRLRRERGANAARHELQLLTATSASMIAFATGGAFLSAVYSPHMFVISAILVVARRLATEQLQSTQTHETTVAVAPKVSLHWALRPSPRRLL